MNFANDICLKKETDNEKVDILFLFSAKHKVRSKIGLTIRDASFARNSLTPLTLCCKGFYKGSDLSILKYYE